MDDTFTASNGVEIAVEEGPDGKQYLIGRVTVTSGELTGTITEATGSEEGMTALREFFRAEEDKRLGRWRWPENHDVTVRVAPKYAQRTGSVSGTVMIQQDSDGYVGYYERDSLPEITDKTGSIVRAGHAYFDAHPESKPWDEAKIGEIWVLTINGTDSPVTFRPGLALHMNGRRADLDRVTAGRRIYPEPSDV